MKIAIVGTSNSVIGIHGGYISALSSGNDIYQLSVGRTNFFYHLKTIEANRDLIEQSDYLIVDHYVNDVNFYFDKFGENYFDLCNEFYLYLSTLNVKILNILFPIRDLARRPSKRFYDYLLDISDFYGISVVDLNRVGFLDNHFTDDIHINRRSSYLVGVYLNDVLCANLSGDRPKNGKCLQMPFHLIDLAKNADFSNVVKYETRLVSIDYVSLSEDLVVECGKDDRLLSVGYVRSENFGENSGISINKRFLRGLSDYGYYLEVVDFDICGEFVISPIFGEDLNVENLMSRGFSKGKFDYCYLTELFFYRRGVDFVCESAIRQKINFDLIDLSRLVSNVLEKASDEKSCSLSSKSVDLIRDVAVSYEKTDINVSYELMRLAHKNRPNGTFIKMKIEEYERLLNV